VDTLFWLGIVAAGLISLLAVGYVVWPLLQPGPTLPLVDDDRLADLLVRKDTLLRAIKELEFDHEMGKVSEEDYQRFAARLRRQALGIMEQIDKVAPASAALDAKLEGEIAHFRQVQANTASDLAESSARNGGIRRDEAASAASTGAKYCSQCGKPVGPNHKFCAECGAPVGEVTE
jgi:hypothetical protein